MWDLIVVGLGPAGSTTARLAAQAGLRVLALDKATFPRYKPCAAGLTGRAADRIPIPRSEYIDFEFDLATIHMGQRSPIRVTDNEYLMATTHREVLDTKLVNLAREAGAEIRENQCVRTVQSAVDSVTVSSSGQVETARFVVGADGANSCIARSLNRHRIDFLPAWEVEYDHGGMLSDQQLKESLIFDLGVVKRGYGWAFPKKQTIAVGVAGRIKTRSAMEEGVRAMLNRFPSQSGWKIISASGHPVPIYSTRYRLAGDGILLAGDAGGLIDPFLGEGIFHAVLSGEIAAGWVAENVNKDRPDYDEYSRCIDREIGCELRVAERLASVIYRFPSFMFGLTQRSDNVLKEFGRCLTREGGYQTFARTIGLPYKLIFLGLR